MKTVIFTGVLAMLTAGEAAAADLATKEQVHAALSGNTVMGSMNDGSTYAEYYAADGTVHADGYTGYWAVLGDRACFTYDNVAVECWHLKLEGNFVSWVQGGRLDGTGSLLRGNPNNF